MAPCSGYRVACEHGAPASGGSPDAVWADPVASLGEPEGVTAAWGGHLHGNGMVWMAWVALIRLGTTLETVGLTWVGVVLFLIAVSAIPGYMSHYCRNYDWREIFDPFRALSRVHQGGAAYWKAWSIVIPVMLCSFGGLLFLGIGFLWTSVWFWQVAAFCFATEFTPGFDLDRRGGAPEPERPDC